MKKLCLLIISMLIIVLTACEASDVSSGINEPPEEILCDFNESYTVEKINSSQIKTKLPAGICKFNDQLVICDRANHTLTVLDLDLHYVKSIGQLGSAPGEFLEPTGITSFKNQLYVLDAGNSRIQIFNTNFDFVRSISLEPLAHHQAGFRYLDLAVDKDGIIYASSNSVGSMDAYIYIIEEDKIYKSDQPFFGFFSEYNGAVYAADTYELYINGDKEGGASGRNYLYRMNGRNIERVSELPNKFTPGDFVILNDKIYMLSGLWGNLYQFSLDGILESGIGKFENSSAERYITALNDTDFIVTNYESKEIYRISLQNDSERKTK